MPLNTLLKSPYNKLSGGIIGLPILYSTFKSTEGAFFFFFFFTSANFFCFWFDLLFLFLVFLDVSSI